MFVWIRNLGMQDLYAAEVMRVQAHLAGAEAELRLKDVSHLNPSARRIRAYVLDALAAYRMHGVFPHNHDVAGQRIPVFIDDHGTRCAMAHLLELVGATSLVARVAETANHARIHELENDPEFLQFLMLMGLSVADAARIQPEYCFRKKGAFICDYVQELARRDCAHSRAYRISMSSGF